MSSPPCSITRPCLQSLWRDFLFSTSRPCGITSPPQRPMTGACPARIQRSSAGMRRAGDVRLRKENEENEEEESTCRRNQNAFSVLLDLDFCRGLFSLPERGRKKLKFIVGMKKAVTNLNLNLISDQPSPNISSPHKMCC